MQKTLEDMAKHLKRIILPEPPESLLAYHAFLHRFCDVLITQGNSYDNSVKGAGTHPFENRAPTFPFFNNVKQMLLNIGLHGALEDNAQSLAIGSKLFIDKISVAKNLECLRFLTDCGICVDGIDLNNKKQNLTYVEIVIISYPDNPAMLQGLKIMAMAEKDFATTVNHDIFLRCDYKVLTSDANNADFTLKYTIKPLSTDVQDFLLCLHQKHMDIGLKCIVEIKGFWIKIMYFYKSNELWGINTSLNNGFNINVKAQNTQKYTNTIKEFSPVLQEIIAKGYGCGRKRSVGGTCDGGCKGLVVPLDDSILSISDCLEAWFEQEMACSGRK